MNPFEIVQQQCSKGNLLFKNGDTAGAIKQFKIGLAILEKPPLKNNSSLDVARAILRMNYASMLRTLGDEAGAKTEYEEALTLHDLKHLATNPSLDETRATLYINYASTLVALGDKMRAKTVFEEALILLDQAHLASNSSLDIQRALLNMNYGVTLYELGYKVRAREEFEKALALHKLEHLATNPALNQDRALLNKDYARTLSTLGNEIGAKKAFEDALTYYQSKDLAANSSLDKSRSELYMNYALTLSALGDETGAKMEYEAALALHKLDHLASNSTLDEDRSRLLMNYAITLSFLDEEIKAKVVYEKAIDLHKLDHLVTNHNLDKDRATLYMNYANTLKALDKMIDAKVEYKKALELHKLEHLASNTALDKSRSRLYMNYALTLSTLGDEAGAKTEYEKALNLHGLVHLMNDSCQDEYRALLHENYANTLGNLGYVMESKVEYETALALHKLKHMANNPTLDKARAQLHMNYACSLSALGDEEGAKIEFEMALALHKLKHLANNPTLDKARAQLHMNFATTLSFLGDETGALEQFEKALALHKQEHLATNSTLDKSRARLRRNYSHTLTTLGKVEAAKVELEAALALHDREHLAIDSTLDEDRARLHMDYASLLVILANKDNEKSEDLMKRSKMEYEEALIVHKLKHLSTNVRLDRDRATLHTNFAALLAGLGEQIEAKMQYETALALHDLDHLAKDLSLDANRATLHMNYANTLGILGYTSDAWSQTLIAINLIIETKACWGSWPKLAIRVLNGIELFAPLNFNWSQYTQTLSHTFIEYMDKNVNEIAAQARPEFTRFHAIYLTLCLDRNHHDLIPQVLSAVNGRRLVDLVNAEYIKHKAIFTEHGDQLHFKYVNTLTEFRRLQLQLQSLISGLNDSRSGTRIVQSHDYKQKHYKKTLKKFTTCHQRWRKLRDDLSRTDPTFTALSLNWAPTLETMQNQLQVDEAIVILIDFLNTREDNTSSHPVLAWVIKKDLQTMVDLPELEQITPFVTKYKAALQRGVPNRLRISFSNQNAVSDDLSPATLFSDIQQKLKQDMAEKLWSLLKKELVGIEQLHLISHGDLHLLPYEISMPDIELWHYPGLICYVMHHHPIQNHILPEALPISVIHSYDSADDPKLATIAFTGIDQGAMQAIWEPKTGALSDYLDNQPITSFPLQRVCFSGHGLHDPQDPWNGGIIIGPQLNMNAEKILDTTQTPNEIQTWACSTGAVTDTIDGEPIGLVTVWLMKQTKYVVAAVMPIADFYSPILVCLYNQALKSGLSCDKALREAKQRLATGNWYANTPEILGPLYIQVIEQELINLSEDARKLIAAKLESKFHYLLSWPGIDTPNIKTLLKRLRSEDQITQQAQLTWQALFQSRKQLGSDPDVQNLLVWVRGFGQPVDS